MLNNPPQHAQSLVVENVDYHEILEFRFEGAYAVHATADPTARTQRTTSKRRGALWVACFAPSHVDEPIRNVPSPSKLIPSRLAVTDTELLYSDAGHPQLLRVPLADIGDATYKRISGGGASVSKVTINFRQPNKEPLHIRGLTDPQKLVELLAEERKALPSLPEVLEHEATKANGVPGGEPARTTRLSSAGPRAEPRPKRSTARALFPELPPSPAAIAAAAASSGPASGCGGMTHLSPFARSPAQQFAVAMSRTAASALHDATEPATPTPGSASMNGPGPPCQTINGSPHGGTPAATTPPAGAGVGLPPPPTVSDSFMGSAPPSVAVTSPQLSPQLLSPPAGAADGPESLPGDPDLEASLLSPGVSPAHPPRSHAASRTLPPAVGDTGASLTSPQVSPGTLPRTAGSPPPVPEDSVMAGASPQLSNLGSTASWGGGSAARGSVARSISGLRLEASLTPMTTSGPICAADGLRDTVLPSPDGSPTSWRGRAESATADGARDAALERSVDVLSLPTARDLELQRPVASDRRHRLSISSTAEPWDADAVAAAGEEAYPTNPLPRASDAGGSSFRSACSSDNELLSAASALALSLHGTEPAEAVHALGGAGGARGGGPASPRAADRELAAADEGGASATRESGNMPGSDGGGSGDAHQGGHGSPHGSGGGSPDDRGTTAMGALGIAAAAATMSAVLTSAASSTLGSIGLAAAPSLGGVAGLTAGGAVAAASVAAAPLSLMGITAAAAVTMVAAAAVTHIRTGSPVRPLPHTGGHYVREARVLALASASRSADPPSTAYSPTIAQCFSVGPHAHAGARNSGSGAVPETTPTRSPFSGPALDAKDGETAAGGLGSRNVGSSSPDAEQPEPFAFPEPEPATGEATAESPREYVGAMAVVDVVSTPEAVPWAGLVSRRRRLFSPGGATVTDSGDHGADGSIAAGGAGTGGDSAAGDGAAAAGSDGGGTEGALGSQPAPAHMEEAGPRARSSAAEESGPVESASAAATATTGSGAEPEHVDGQGASAALHGAAQSSSPTTGTRKEDSLPTTLSINGHANMHHTEPQHPAPVALYPDAATRRQPDGARAHISAAMAVALQLTLGSPKAEPLAAAHEPSRWGGTGAAAIVAQHGGELPPPAHHWAVQGWAPASSAAPRVAPSLQNSPSHGTQDWQQMVREACQRLPGGAASPAVLPTRTPLDGPGPSVHSGSAGSQQHSAYGANHVSDARSQSYGWSPVAQHMEPLQPSEPPVRVLFPALSASAANAVVGHGYTRRPVTRESSVQTEAQPAPITECAVQTELGLDACSVAAVSLAMLAMQSLSLQPRGLETAEQPAAQDGASPAGMESMAGAGVSGAGAHSGASGSGPSSPQQTASTAQFVYDIGNTCRSRSCSGGSGFAGRQAAAWQQDGSPRPTAGARDWYMLAMDLQLQTGGLLPRPSEGAEERGTHSTGASPPSTSCHSASCGAGNDDSLAGGRYATLPADDGLRADAESSRSSSRTSTARTASALTPRHHLADVDVHGASPMSDDRRPLLGDYGIHAVATASGHPDAVAPHDASSLHGRPGSAGSSRSSESLSRSISTATPSSVGSGLYSPIASEAGSAQLGASSSTEREGPGHGAGSSADHLAPRELHAALLACDEASSPAASAGARGDNAAPGCAGADGVQVAAQSVDDDAAADTAWLPEPGAGGSGANDDQASATGSTAASPRVAMHQGAVNGPWSLGLQAAAVAAAAAGQARAPPSRHSSTGSCPGAETAPAQGTIAPIFNTCPGVAGNQLAVPVPLTPTASGAVGEDVDGCAPDRGLRQSASGSVSSPRSSTPGRTGSDVGPSPGEAALALLGLTAAAVAASAASEGRSDNTQSQGGREGPETGWDAGSQAQPGSPGVSEISSAVNGDGFFYYGGSAGPSPFGTPGPAGCSAAAAAARGAGAPAAGIPPAGAPGQPQYSEDLYNNPLFVSPAHGARRADGRPLARQGSSGAISLPMAPYAALSLYGGTHGDDMSRASSQALSGFPTSPPSVSTEGPPRGSRRRRSLQGPSLPPRAPWPDPAAPRGHSGSGTDDTSEAAAGAAVEPGEADATEGREVGTGNGGSEAAADSSARGGSSNGGGSNGGSSHDSLEQQGRKRARSGVPDAAAPLAGDADGSAEATTGLGQRSLKQRRHHGQHRPQPPPPPGQNPDALLYLASPLMVLNPAYSQSAASSSSAAASPHANAADSGATAAPSHPAATGLQPQVGAAAPVGSGLADIGDATEALPAATPSVPMAPAPAPAAIEPPVPALPLLDAEDHGVKDDAAADSSAGDGGGHDGDCLASSHLTPREQMLPALGGSPFSVGSWQGSPTSQQAAHAAALLRSANDAVDCAREAVQRGDTEWLARVTATLQAVQTAIEALREF